MGFDPEQWRRERRERFLINASVVLFFVLLLVGWLAWNQHAYGDWECAFKQCRVVKVVP